MNNNHTRETDPKISKNLDSAGKLKGHGERLRKDKTYNQTKNKFLKNNSRMGKIIN